MLIYPYLPDKLFQGEANPAPICVSHNSVSDAGVRTAGSAQRALGTGGTLNLIRTVQQQLCAPLSPVSLRGPS